MDEFMGLVCFIFLLVAYFLPWIIADNRKHHNSTAIFWLNTLLGWTVIGWMLSLVWAHTKRAP